MSDAEGEVFDGGRDDSGEGGYGGWDMRVLSFARTRTRCTKPNWELHLCSVRRFLHTSGAPGSRAVLDRTSGMRALP